MTIRLSYKYSELDKINIFGLSIAGYYGSFDLQYINWIYFYLGEALAGNETFRLMPYEVYEGKLLKEYKFCNCAQRQALLIINNILKTQLNHGR